jgi:hypothetical protein
MKKITIIGLVALLVLFLELSVACEQRTTVVIENQTNQVFHIYWGHETDLGIIEPGEQISKGNISLELNSFLITARNSQGAIVYSKTLTRQQMQHTKGTDKYTVVITPSDITSISSDNNTK